LIDLAWNSNYIESNNILNITWTTIVNNSSSSSTSNYSWWTWFTQSKKILIAKKDAITKQNWGSSTKELKVSVKNGTKTSSSTYYRTFTWKIYWQWVYRIMYERNKWINLSEKIWIEIKDRKLINNFRISIKRKSTDEYKIFTDYTYNRNSIFFETNQGLELKIEELTWAKKEITKINKESITYKKHEMKFYIPKDKTHFIKFINSMESKYWDKLRKLSNKTILIKIPSIFEKIEKIDKSKLKLEYQYLYNFLGKIYLERYNLVNWL